MKGDSEGSEMVIETTKIKTHKEIMIDEQTYLVNFSYCNILL
jgi:hypothetical protein